MKMLKEERELREWVRWATCDLPDAEEKRFAFKAITALVKAVREDCAFRIRCASAGESRIEVGVAEHAIMHHYGYKKEDDPLQAATIRRK